MLEIQSNNKSESEILFAPEQEDAPFAIEIVSITHQELIELEAGKNCYRSLYQRVLEKNLLISASMNGKSGYQHVINSKLHTGFYRIITAMDF